MDKWYRWVYQDLLYCIYGTAMWSHLSPALAKRHITQEDMIHVVEAVKDKVDELNEQVRTKNSTIINLRAQLDSVERGSVILESAILDYKSKRR